MANSLVEVELLAGVAGDSGAESRDIERFVQERLSNELPGELLLILRTKNVGSIAVDITDWTLTVATGMRYSAAKSSPNPSLPCHLKAGSSVDFQVTMKEAMLNFRFSSDQHYPIYQVEAAIQLASGEKFQSPPQALPTLPSEPRRN
jgi:hypothetical protein